VEQHVERVLRYRDAGVDEMIVSLVDVADDGAVGSAALGVGPCRHLRPAQVQTLGNRMPCRDRQMITILVADRSPTARC